jgi:RNase H-fold protein (predicted Holliday junction resolvase)
MCILTKLSKRLRKQKETEQQLTVFKLRTFPEKKSKLKAKKKVRIQTDQKKLKQPTTSDSNKTKTTVFGKPKPKKTAKPKITKSIKYFKNTVDPDLNESIEFLPERLSMRNDREYDDIPLHLVPSVENIEHSYL